jgi:branched-chain amino acid transport system permease protein
VLGITGLLSFGHAMFFAVGAYSAGIMLKSFGWSLPLTFVGVMVAALLNALLFGLVLPRVKGIAFALVTLGLASVFYIVVQSSELSDFTGADVGLQGAPVPDWIDTNVHRFRVYLIALALLVIAYVLYRAIVRSPTGAVLLANRENEERALSLGYNTFWFKLFALTVASLTAGLAGMLWTIQQPIVTPQVASLGWTVAALLMILIGGVGTLSGAIVGAAVYRLLSYYLERWFGGSAPVLIGAAYIAIVLFLPFGIVGTWRARAINRRAGLERLRSLFGVRRRRDE